jgi:hypothetical protein
MAFAPTTDSTDIYSRTTLAPASTPSLAHRSVGFALEHKAWWIAPAAALWSLFALLVLI